jgi:hypothetical protein
MKMLEIFYTIFPLAGTYFYLYFPKKWVQNISPSTINNFAIAHNAFLQVFSMYTAANLTYALFSRGLILKSNYYFEQEHTQTIMFYFYLSKYYEYIDTFILYAKKKKPLFLQTFHHTGAVLVWHLGYICKTDGLFFVCLLNSYVHSFMYFYYLLTLLKINVHKYRIYITTMQIAQLIFGAIALPFFYYGLESQKNKLVICIFDIYIFFLIFLFAKFMLENYFAKVKSY